MTSGGSGEVASGPPQIAETGAESALVPAAAFLAAAAGLGHLRRRAG